MPVEIVVHINFVDRTRGPFEQDMPGTACDRASCHCRGLAAGIDQYLDRALEIRSRHQNVGVAPHPLRGPLIVAIGDGGPL